SLIDGDCGNPGIFAGGCAPGTPGKENKSAAEGYDGVENGEDFSCSSAGGGPQSAGERLVSTGEVSMGRTAFSPGISAGAPGRGTVSAPLGIDAAGVPAGNDPGPGCTGRAAKNSFASRVIMARSGNAPILAG